MSADKISFRDVSQFDRPSEYSIAVGRESQTSTKILRCPNFSGSLLSNFDPPLSINSPWELFLLGHSNNPNGKCLGCKKNENKFEWCTYGQVRDWCLALGSAMLAPLPPLDTETEPGTPFVQAAVPPPLKVVASKITSPSNAPAPSLVPTVEFDDVDRPMQLVGVCSRSRVEWVVMNLAANAYGVTVVPIYCSLGIESMAHILTQTRVPTVALGSDGVDSFASTIERHGRANLQNIILFDKATPDQTSRLISFGVQILFWRDVLAWGESNLKSPPPPSIDGIDSICYTSGTTGCPKGVVIPNSAVVSVVAGILKGPLGEAANFCVVKSDVHFAFLPLAHIFERVVEVFLLSRGAGVAFFSGDIKKLTDEIQIIRPTVFVGVPRVFNKIHDQIFAQLATKSMTAQALFCAGLRSKCQKFRRTGSTKNFVWDHLVFSKVRNVLGGRVRVLLSGSAPLDISIGERLAVLLSAPLVEGFGLTETTGASLCTKLGHPLEGHVGGPVPCCEIKLESIPDLNYCAKDSQPSGEILIRGPSVFRGYFRNKIATDEVLDAGGWFRTGDIGELLPNGAIKIIDRRKNVFKLSQGEFVAPERLEAIYSSAPLVGKIFVYGNSGMSSLGAVVVLDREACDRWWDKHRRGRKESLDLGRLVGDQEIDWSDGSCLRQTVMSQLGSVAQKNSLCGFETIRSVLLTDVDFSEENGLLTPSLKLIRREAVKKFGHQLDRLLKDENLPPAN